MSWFDKQRHLHRRVDLGREFLAASVEEVMAQDEPAGDIWSEEDGQASPAGKTSIIPPLLRLQSRPLPVVLAEKAGRAQVERQQPLLESSSHVEPQAKRLGRSTRVHLQAVRSERTPAFVAEGPPAVETAVSGGQAVPVPSRQDVLATGDMREPGSQIGSLEVSGTSPIIYQQAGTGSGVIKQGQKDATVSNPGISDQSVVSIMLTGNPGPVVVQYVSLHPRLGFTLHLSAPAIIATPFNYLVWPC